MGVFFGHEYCLEEMMMLFPVLVLSVVGTKGNSPPRFQIQGGQGSQLVLQLKEGDGAKPGTRITRYQFYFYCFELKINLFLAKLEYFQGYKVYTINRIRIRGFDPDGDSLTFGVVGDQNLVQVEQIDSEQADVVLLRFKLETNYFHKMLENTFSLFCICFF